MAQFIPGQNDLETVHPDIAAEWHPTKNGDLTPKSVSYGSGRKVWWLGQCGHEWEAIVKSRSKGYGCPICVGKIALPGFNDLATLNPALAAEWHPTKNGDLTPEKVTPGREQKVWWRCERGHEWKAAINSRNSGNGCPICANQQVLAGYNDLATVHPELLKEWDFTKNAIHPSEVIAGSGKAYFWRCAKGHSWSALIYHRLSGLGCPYCSGKRTLAGFNDLATTHPEIAAEWDFEKNAPLLPSDVGIGSHKMAFWRCQQGHQWKAVVYSRKINGCPVCGNKQVLAGYNDLATTHPQLSAEWHPTKNNSITPAHVSSGSDKAVWWQCPDGHEWKASISSRVRGNGCPTCANELHTSFPEQAIYYYFRQITAAVNRYRYDKRTEIDVYLPDYRFGVEYDGYFHQTEAAKERDARKNATLAAADITLIRVIEVDDLDGYADSSSVIYCTPSPSQLYLNEVVQKLLDRLNTITGQKFYLDIDVARDRPQIYTQYICTKKENSLSVKYPHLADQWHPTKNGRLTPETVTPGSHKKVWWRCSLGHEWEAIVKSRVKGNGCPICYGRRSAKYGKQADTWR